MTKLDLAEAFTALSAKNLSFESVVTSGGTTTLTASSGRFQLFTGSANQTVVMPTTGIPAGEPLIVQNASTGVITIQSSNGNVLGALATGNTALLWSLTAGPTTAGHWLTLLPATLNTTQTLTSKSLNDPKVVRSINAQTGTTYTPVLTDRNKLITMSNAAASVFTVPLNAAVAFPVVSEFDLVNLGAGAVTITPITGEVTLIGNTTLNQNQMVTLTKIATDTWVIK